MAKRSFRVFFVVPILAALVACATPVNYAPVEMTATANQPRKQLARRVDVQLDSGYSRVLKEGSEWTNVGRVPQGDLYKPYKDVFTLEGANVHEAYLVVAGQSLVGFYLPVERGFAPLKNKVSLTLN